MKHPAPTILFEMTVVLFGAAPVVTGCGGGGGSTPGADGGGTDGGVADAQCPSGSGSGQLTLTVNAPVALMPVVQLTGGGLTAPMALVAGTPVTVPGGAYVITAKRAKVAPAAGDFIGKAYYASQIDFSGCIQTGATATATVTYAVEPGSGKVWTAPSNGAGAIAAYDEPQMHMSTPQAPAVTRTMGLTQVSDLAFDANGNLWVADSGVGGGIVVHPMLSLGTAADRRGALKLTGIEEVRALAFDAQGNLWAAQAVPGGMDRVIKLEAASLAFDAAAATTVMRAAIPGPATTSAELVGPADMTFDATGDLWITSQDRGSVLELTAAQLAAGGSAAPAVVLRARKTMGPIMFTYNAPRAVTFDAAGNLWVGFIQGPVRLAAAQLGATATIDDPLEIEPMGMGGAGVSEAPQVIDGGGGMWLSRTNIGMPAALVRLPPAALMAGGPQATSPNMPSNGLGNGAGVLVANPVPPGLPIRD